MKCDDDGKLLVPLPEIGSSMDQAVTAAREQLEKEEHEKAHKQNDPKTKNFMEISSEDDGETGNTTVANSDDEQNAVTGDVPSQRARSDKEEASANSKAVELKERAAVVTMKIEQIIDYCAHANLVDPYSEESYDKLCRQLMRLKAMQLNVSIEAIPIGQKQDILHYQRQLDEIKRVTYLDNLKRDITDDRCSDLSSTTPKPSHSNDHNKNKNKKWRSNGSGKHRHRSKQSTSSNNRKRPLAQAGGGTSPKRRKTNAPSFCFDAAPPDTSKSKQQSQPNKPTVICRSLYPHLLSFECLLCVSFLTVSGVSRD